MPDLPTRIQLTWAPSVAGAGERLAPLLPVREEPVRIVPAPLNRQNVAVAELRDALRAHGRRTTLLLPRGALTSVLGRSRDRWMRVGAAGSTYRVDARLDGAHVLVLAIMPELRRGPFALDLPFHFMHPADRLRLAAQPAWRRLLADITAGAPPALSVLLAPVADGWLAAATTDAIAAELWALALAERWLGEGIEMPGPWEEPAVQRATELNLGVRIPADMVPWLPDGAAIPAMARELLQETASRLGITHLFLTG